MKLYQFSVTVTLTPAFSPARHNKKSGVRVGGISDEGVACSTGVDNFTSITVLVLDCFLFQRPLTEFDVKAHKAMDMGPSYAPHVVEKS